MMKRVAKTPARRAGAIALLFFLFKGVVWLLAAAGLALTVK